MGSGTSCIVLDSGNIDAALPDGVSTGLDTGQLNVNLWHFHLGAGIPQHRNDEVDVVLVVLSGEGVVTVDEQAYPAQAGQVFIIAKGARRSWQCTGDLFVGITCHQRRSGLQLR